jgi:molybdenum cofactor guanylyltransferase
MTRLPPHSDTIAVVLAGGRASRLGGGDKGLRLIGGESLLAHVLARLRPQVAAIVLSANGDGGRFSPLGLRVLSDGPAGSVGPLAGILAALDHAAEAGAAFVVSVPTDAPFLPSDLVAGLHEARRSGSAAGAVAASFGRVHPVVALWPVSARDSVREAVSDGRRRVGDLVTALAFGRAEWSGPVDPFFNINTPEDLARAEAIAAASDRGRT